MTDIKLTSEQLRTLTDALTRFSEISAETAVYFTSYSDLSIEIDGQRIGVRFDGEDLSYSIDHRNY